MPSGNAADNKRNAEQGTAKEKIRAGGWTGVPEDKFLTESRIQMEPGF